jgi:hypothetical protein
MSVRITEFEARFVSDTDVDDAYVRVEYRPYAPLPRDYHGYPRVSVVHRWGDIRTHWESDGHDSVDEFAASECDRDFEKYGYRKPVIEWLRSVEKQAAAQAPTFAAEGI